MKKQSPSGILFGGRLAKAGITVYFKQGQMIARVARSMEKRSNTLPQFVQRQRMRHTIVLWQMIEAVDPMFTQRKTTYQGFASLANRLPVVYVPKSKNDISLLMPDIPVSDGTLPPIKQQLGEYNGIAALLTNLKTNELQHGEELRLYTAEQRIEGRTPRVRFKKRVVPLNEFTLVEGCLALVDTGFADEQKGWALVRVYRERCSTQTIVTRCTYYQQFTTEEALQEAAKSYGGLTK